MHNLQMGSPQPSVRAPATPWRQSTPWWWRQPAPLKPRSATDWQVKLPRRAPIWPTVTGALAALAALGLLFAFHGVVAQVVVQADLERAETVATHETVWNCKLMHRLRDRDACLAPVIAAHQLKTQLGGAQPAQPEQPEQTLAEIDAQDRGADTVLASTERVVK